MDYSIEIMDSNEIIDSHEIQRQTVAYEPITSIIYPLQNQFRGKLILANLAAVIAKQNEDLIDENTTIISLCPINEHLCDDHRVYSNLQDEPSDSAYYTMRQIIRDEIPRLLQLLNDPEHTVIVHCKMGISRSVTFVCAILLQHAFDNNITVIDQSDVINHVRTCRIDPISNRYLQTTDPNLVFEILLSNFIINRSVLL
jgi:protein-tyrosine phosphatase